MEPIEVFEQLRDVCDEVVKAMEAGDVTAAVDAVGRFIGLLAKYGIEIKG